MRFATLFAFLLMWVALVGCTLPAGRYTVSVNLPGDISLNTPTPEALPTWTAPTLQPFNYVTNTTTSAWNIRSEPSVNGRVYEQMQPGETLELQGRLESGWLQVERAGGGTGFIDGRCCIDHQ